MKFYPFNVLLILFLIISCKPQFKKQGNQDFKIFKKSIEEKAIAAKERWLYDFDMQKNPITGEIPREEKEKELENAIIGKQKINVSKTKTNTYISRGPSNLGGRTRALKVDVSDLSGNTMLAGGVSGGVFRTINGGSSWVKVSPFDEIHNVTTLAQDPRVGFQNIWYYGTGEFSGNSASIQEQYLGNGIWKSIDSGLTWQQIPETANGTFHDLDNFLDLVIDMEVHPITGELYVGTAGALYRITNNGVEVEFTADSNNLRWTDLEISNSGRVYLGVDGGSESNSGVWTSETGVGGWSRISENLNDWSPTGRITLAIAPSNENIVYALYNNGESNSSINRKPEADLWMYNLGTNSWLNYSDKLPDENGADSDGNDPFSIQGGYDLVVSVKPDDSNFVVIGGTNIYKIEDITNDIMFSRIGGYKNPGTYELYDVGGINHHPDIHAIEWGGVSSNVLYTGTDGGVHKTNSVGDLSVTWSNLNNNYLTYQYYYVNMVNKEGEDFVIGGAQDNGTTIGGLSSGKSDKSSMDEYFGGDGAAVAVASSTSGLDKYTLYASSQNGRILRGNENRLTADIRPIESYDGNNNPEYYPSQFVTYFYMDPENSQTIYYAANYRLLRTNEAETVNGDTWTLLGGLPFSERINTMETTRGIYNESSSYLFIGGRGGNIFRLNDPKNIADLSTLKKITPPGVTTGLIDANDGQYTSDIAVHPTNPDIIMVVYSSYGDNIKNIFITNNATAEIPTWIEVERNLNSHSIRSAAITEVNNEITYFVGTARGLYSSNNPSANDWVIEGGDVLGIPIVSDLVYRHSDNFLLVGTHGNGMFETNLNSSLSTNEIKVESVELAIYPNPTQFELHFETNDFELNNRTEFYVFNIRGKEIIKGELKNKTIDISNLSAGIYIVKLKLNDAYLSRKFIKN